MRSARCYMHIIERSRHGGRLLFMKNIVQNFGDLKWQSAN